MMFWFGNMMGFWGSLLGTVAIGCVVALLVVGVLALARSGQGDRRLPTRERSASQAEELRAEEILAARYARGEIGEDEYRHGLEVLRATGRV